MVPGRIRLLPAELLSEIFKICVETEGIPWLLVRVCKAWKRIALSTSRLWSHLHIQAMGGHHPPYQFATIDGQVQYYFGRVQFCPSTQHVQAALDRSGGVPLSVTFRQSEPTLEDWFLLALRTFFASPVSSRIQELDIKTTYISDSYLGPDESIGSFPLLRTIALPNLLPKVTWMTALLQSVSSTSTYLQIVRIDDNLVPLSAVPESFWLRIKSLCICYHGDHIAGPQNTDQQALNSVATKLGNLQALVHIPHHFPNSQTPSATWRAMRHLTLKCELGYLGRLSLPLLESLRLKIVEATAGDPQGEYKQLSYPRLVSLLVEDANYSWPRCTKGAFPILENVTLAWSGGYMEKPALTEVLESLPSARNMKIIAHIGNHFWQRLMQELGRDRGDIICPNLQKLHLGTDRCRVSMARGECLSLLKSLVSTRRQLGNPLKEVLVHLGEGSVDLEALLV